MKSQAVLANDVFDWEVLSRILLAPTAEPK
jgi:hypothetical protein